MNNKIVIRRNMKYEEINRKRGGNLKKINVEKMV